MSDGKTQEEFAERHGMEIGIMKIERAVSRFPREINVLVCPKCKGHVFLFHSRKKPDPFIGAKVMAGILSDKGIAPRQWLGTCWTDNCDFHVDLDEKELVTCPECNRFFMEYYSLYDHMKFQCTAAAKDNKMIREAGAGMYIADLVALEFNEDKDDEE